MHQAIVRLLTTCALILAAVAHLAPVSADSGAEAVTFCEQTFPLKTTNIRCNVESVSDLSTLATLTNLTALYLRNTQVSDFSFLTSLINLETLNISDTPVNVKRIKDLKTKLPRCSISF